MTAGRESAILRVLVLAGVVCGAIVAIAHEATLPIIAKNRIAARADAARAVIPGAVTVRAFRPEAGGRYAQAPADATGDDVVLAGYDADGTLTGIAIPASAMGYQDVVRILFGYDPRAGTIVGLRVLESRETPGLGDRVETDPAYRANFAALPVPVVDGALQHPIEIVSPGQKTETWHVDTISGATITSRAVAEMIAAAAARRVPELQAHLADFLDPGPTPGEAPAGGSGGGDSEEAR